MVQESTIEIGILLLISISVLIYLQPFEMKLVLSKNQPLFEPSRDQPLGNNRNQFLETDSFLNEKL